MQARKIFIRSGLALAILSATGWLASVPAGAQTYGAAPAKQADATKPTDDDAAEFTKLDANKDGVLDKKEAAMEPRLLVNYNAADANKDSKIDKKEWTAFQKNKALVVKK
jgi:hypothetical protein